MSHYQAQAEERWDHNAKDVANVVAQVARDVDPRVIVVAGDVRSVQLLEKHLSTALQPLVRRIDGNRGADGDTSHVAERVLEALGEAQRNVLLALLDKYA